jgi:hypothetical protein
MGLSQKLHRNEVDEFTGKRIKFTEHDVLCQNFNMSAFVQSRKIDSLYFLNIKLMLGGSQYHTIDRDNRFYLKMMDSTVVELRSIEYSQACKGCGARGFSGSIGYGTQTNYQIDFSQLNELILKDIIKVRIYTSKGYVECNVKGEKESIIKRQLLLINKP